MQGSNYHDVEVIGAILEYVCHSWDVQFFHKLFLDMTKYSQAA